MPFAAHGWRCARDYHTKSDREKQIYEITCGI